MMFRFKTIKHCLVNAQKNGQFNPVFSRRKFYPTTRHHKHTTRTETEAMETRLAIKNERLSLTIDRNTMEFPLVWLRDNCRCPDCYHQVSKSRIIDWEHFDINARAREGKLINKNVVNIKWSDDHSSDYNIQWLQDHCFSKEHREQYTKSEYRPTKVAWDRDTFRSIFKSFNYGEILKADTALEKWLRNLSVYGVALVTDVPDSPQACRVLANRVEFIKRTHYGEEFEVKAKPGTTNVAYLSSNLQIHTDLPYYEYKPGVNLLHCVTQTASRGGENMLCDGLYVAHWLKEHKRKSYDILKDTEVEWEDFGEERGNKFHSVYRSPVICEDKNGDIVRINYSTPQRGSHFDTSVDNVQLWYEALKDFVNAVYAQSAKFKMIEGNILCFDNKRLLHGRTRYEDTPDNYRHVIGVYLDWDFIYSRIRVLKEDNEK